MNKKFSLSTVATVTISVLAPAVALAGGATGADLQEIVVKANRIPLSADARTASEGTVLGEQLENRPLLRVGELLEVVPGLIVTQHAGDGKANQYFLRGFNLDHGTDFSTRVDGVPVNMPTHGHGQGYMDLNFVIPELVDKIVYRKGTYYADLGNFSAAGSAEMTYKTELRPTFSLTSGKNGYDRAVAAGSTELGGGSLLLGAEIARTNGPWDLAEDLRKYNALARWSREGEHSGIAVDLSGYHGKWLSTDQIPLRAVQSGALDRFGYIDPTDGGESHRYSLSMQAFNEAGASRFDYSLYAVDYQLQLFSNFTYGIDPVRGDQFEQSDNRRIYGGAATWSHPLAFGAEGSTLRAGVDLRADRISPVALQLTQARVPYETIRSDRVNQELGGLWTALATRWTPWLRSEFGLRADQLHYSVASDLAANSGSGHDSLVSPKASLALGPWRETEFFLATGKGFHSNDARGATITVDPTDPTVPAERVTPLVQARGSELGVRTSLLPRTQLSFSLWRLDVDSELLFVGDGGTTEPSRPSRRQGIEVGLYSKPFDWLIVDADYAASRARFTDFYTVGDRIPGAVDQVASLGVAIDHSSGWFGGARLRYLGPAALIEDNSTRAGGSTLVNVEAGRRFANDRWKITASLYNVFDRKANDITYFYASQLRGESAPVDDVHFHPVEPRTLRVSAQVRF